MPRTLPVLAMVLFAGFGSATAEVAANETPASGPRGALDGLVFMSTMIVDSYDSPFDDRITFRDGAFHSKECQRACDFGWTPYYTRMEGDAVAFVVETACSDAPQSVRFEGRVEGNRIEGTAIWTVERFYWTRQRHATFSGTLETDPAGPATLLTE